MTDVAVRQWTVKEPHAYRPTPLEIASGLVFGLTPPERLPTPEEAGSPLEALERAILPALRRPPCLVGFSGGPDSSSILALAVRLARREGLELPIPATNRFPNAPGRDDRESQERIIVHLGLTEWARFESDAELDIVGRVAMSMLRRHGLMAAVNVHFHMPLIEEASGGSLITGTGGNEALSATHVSWAGPGLPRRARPAVQNVVPFRRRAEALSWLRPAAQNEAYARCWADIASEPLRRQDRLAWVRRLRSVRIWTESLAHVAARLRVEVRHPFLDPQFSAALRTAALQEFAPDLLPTDLLADRTAPDLDEVFWNQHSRAIAETWDGDGIDPALVDPEALREEWSRERPDRRTFLLLQSVALAREGRSVARQLADAVGGFA